MNILLLTHRVPYPPNRGDRIRAYHLLRYLSTRHNVSLACLADEDYASETKEVLQSMTSRLKIVRQHHAKRWVQALLHFGLGQSATSGLFYQSELSKVLKEWKTEVEFDCVIAFCSSMAPYAFEIGKNEIPVLVDLVDVDSQKWLDYAQKTKGLKQVLYQVEGRRLRKFEQEIASHSVAVALVSEAEAMIYQKFCPSEKTCAILNGVDSDYFQIQDASIIPHPFSCVFIGALDYGANIDALQWFCTEVWPLVRSQHANARLSIVGRNPTTAIKRLADLPGVIVEADVADVRPFLQQSEVAIAPLRIARGIQNKVLEAMAMGMPVLASAEALAGIDLQPQIHALKAGTPEQWCSKLTHLWQSAAYRARIGSAAREFVLQNHVWESTLKPWDRLLEECQAFLLKSKLNGKSLVKKMDQVEAIVDN